MVQGSPLDMSTLLEMLDDIRQAQSRLASSVDLLEEKLNAEDHPERRPGSWLSFSGSNSADKKSYAYTSRPKSQHAGYS